MPEYDFILDNKYVTLVNNFDEISLDKDNFAFIDINTIFVTVILINLPKNFKEFEGKEVKFNNNQYTEIKLIS